MTRFQWLTLLLLALILCGVITLVGVMLLRPQTQTMIAVTATSTPISEDSAATRSASIAQTATYVVERNSVVETQIAATSTAAAH